MLRLLLTVLIIAFSSLPGWAQLLSDGSDQRLDGSDQRLDGSGQRSDVSGQPSHGSSRARYSGRLFSLEAGGGFSMYAGEFDGTMSVASMNFSAGYSVFPALAVELHADIGSVSYHRAPTVEDQELYRFQFGSLEARDRSTSYSSFALQLAYNFFPKKFFTIHLTAGGGLVVYRADDYRDGTARIRPKADFPTSFNFPIGLRVEYFLLSNLSLNFTAKQNFLFTGEFDAYDPQQLADEYRHEYPGSDIDVPSNAGNDSYTSLALTARWYLFESGDYDRDLLLNSEEEAIGSDPYSADTDVDGLTDYEEVKIHLTSPLKPDTDDDGLGDYFEITKFGTDPLKPDTDSDRLTDGEEIYIYKTDPLKSDTDEDRLSDYEEVIYYETDPLNPDTDYDGLDDYAEIKVYGTNPLKADTDEDGIYDFNEIVTYNTNPQDPDTDADRLGDYDEIAVYGTNPLNPDTDSDSISDYDEIFVTRTDPLKNEHLSAEQLAAAGLSRSPAGDADDAYVARLVETRPLPGGGVSYLLEPVRPVLGRGPEAETRAGAGRYAGDGRHVGDGRHASDGSAGSLESGSDTLTVRFQPRAVQHVDPPAQLRDRPKFVRLDTLALKPGDMLSFVNIRFEFDRDELQSEYMALLNESVKLFSQYPSMVVEIRGHTDADGSVEYNQELSERRAGTVRRFLLRRGVAAERLTSRGFGELEPIAQQNTEEGKARNRRVEFYIATLGEKR